MGNSLLTTLLLLVVGQRLQTLSLSAKEALVNEGLTSASA